MLDGSGVRYVGGAGVTDIEPGTVTLDDGVRIDTDLILAAIGIEQNSGLAESAGLDLDEGRIVVDEHMHTSADSVLAVGDVASAHNPTAGRHIATEHWQDAVDQGRWPVRPRRVSRSRGMSYRDSGRPSATTPSSTRHGVTASTLRTWSNAEAAFPTADSPSGISATGSP